MNEFNNHKTTWVNDTEVTIRFKLYLETAGGSKKMVSKVIEIEPGKQLSLPSSFDSAIRKERDGKIVGGLCPWLKKKGETNLNLLPELDYFARKKEQDMTELAEKLRKQKDLEEAAKLLS